MTPTDKDIKVLGRIVSVAVDSVVADASQIKDTRLDKNQETINLLFSNSFSVLSDKILFLQEGIRSGINTESITTKRIEITPASAGYGTTTLVNGTIRVDNGDSFSEITTDEITAWDIKALHNISATEEISADTINASNAVNTGTLNADNAIIGDDLTVRGTLYTDNTNVDGSLTVDGPATFNGNITLEPGDTLTVEGEDDGNIVLHDGEITCDTLTAVDNIVTNDLTADGDVTFNSGLSIRENLLVEGNCDLNTVTASEIYSNTIKPNTKTIQQFGSWLDTTAKENKIEIVYVSDSTGTVAPLIVLLSTCENSASVGDFVQTATLLNPGTNNPALSSRTRSYRNSSRSWSEDGTTFVSNLI